MRSTAVDAIVDLLRGASVLFFPSQAMLFAAAFMGVGTRVPIC
jgi:hypothetical protein